MSKVSNKPIVYALTKRNKFRLKISTGTSDEFSTIAFLRVKATVKPKIEKKSYKEDVSQIKSVFYDFARQVIEKQTSFEKNYIFSITLAEDSVKFSKISHLHYDLFIKTKFPFTFLKHKTILVKISNTLDAKLIALLKKHNMDVI